METIRRGERVKGKAALVAGAGSIAPVSAVSGASSARGNVPGSAAPTPSRR